MSANTSDWPELTKGPGKQPKAPRLPAKPTLAVVPAARRYGPQDLEALRACLTAQEAMPPAPIRAPEDVLLNAAGLVQRRYRFTREALGQLCVELGPGLLSLVDSLSGLDRREDRKLDATLAIRFYNGLVQLRFGALSGCGLIMDDRARQIVGLVGSRYRFFSNVALLDQVLEFAAQMPTATFAGAVLSGRRLCAWFQHPSPLFSVPGANGKAIPFYTGWHISNSEIGDCAVRAGWILIRPDFGRVLCPVGRVAHVRGSNFRGKVSVLLNRLPASLEKLKPETCRKAMFRLRGVSLRLAWSAEDHGTRMRTLVGRLARESLSRRSVTRVIHHVLLHGSEPLLDVLAARAYHTRLPSLQTLREMQQRTGFDLLSALMTFAQWLSPKEREAMETAAYRVLSNPKLLA